MATILAYLNPLIGFLYWGGIVLALGTVVVIWPAPAGGARAGLRRIARRRRERALLMLRARRAAGRAAAAPPRWPPARRQLPGDRGVAHLPVRLRPDGALLQPPAVSVGHAAAPGDPRADWHSGSTRTQVLAHFEGKYGEKILSSPTARGFNLTAWIMPFIILALGAVFVVLHAAALAARRCAAVGARPGGGSTAPPASWPHTSARSSASSSASTADAGDGHRAQLAARRRGARLRRLAAVPGARAGSGAARAGRRLAARAPEARRLCGDQGSGVRPAHGQAVGRGLRRDHAALPPAGARRRSPALEQAKRAEVARRGRAPARLAFCPGCGEKLPPRANFCGNCGRSLRETAA